MSDPAHNKEADPVQAYVNRRKQWERWASGEEPPPPYDGLLQAGLADVTHATAAALGQVRDAYLAGYGMRMANERAHALMLHALDLLHAHVAAEEAAVEAARARTAGGAGDDEDMLARATVAQPPPPVLLEQVLAHRQRALDELAQAAAEAGVVLQDAHVREARALAYEQGPVGPPPMPAVPVVRPPLPPQ